MIFGIIHRLRKHQDTFKEQLKILLWFHPLPTDRDLSRPWTTISFYCRIIGMICRHHHLLRAIRIEKIRIFPGKSGFLQQFRFIGMICHHHHLLRAIRIEKKPKIAENNRKSPKIAQNHRNLRNKNWKENMWPRYIIIRNYLTYVLHNWEMKHMIKLPNFYLSGMILKEVILRWRSITYFLFQLANWEKKKLFWTNKMFVFSFNWEKNLLS